MVRKLQKIMLTGFLLLAFIKAEAQKRVVFKINTNAERKAISPLIYGTNDKYKYAAAKRLGGNRLTNYNWENNASNAGRDWYHSSDEYVPWERGVPESEYDVPGSALKYFHNTSLAQGAYSLITLPMAKYVTADRNGSVSEEDAAPSSRWKLIGHRKPSPFSLVPDLTDNYVYTDEEVNFLIQNYGESTSNTGVKAYELDNEPGIWFESHSRMWGTDHLPVNFLMNSSFELSTRIKELDPKAEIYGPASWGVSEFEDLQGAPDWSAVKGSYRNFVSYYLGAMKAKQEADAKKQRLLDVLTLHWYPQGRRDGLSPFDNGTDYHTNAARMEMTRSLWDPSYIEPTWIGEDADKVDQFLPFIPKMKKTIDTHYPGTKFAITEYSYMGVGHPSGGIAQADALGIFGKQGLYFATYWGGVIDYIKAGFDLYRDYDGKGSKFGDISVQSITDDIVVSSVHASIESNDESKTHIVAMNKSQDESIIATIKIEADKVYKGARVWAFDSNGSTLRQLKNVRVINNNTFEYTIPPLTACHLVLTEEDLSLFPDFEAATIDPAAGYSDGTAKFKINAHLVDGDHNITKVTADLSQLGGPKSAEMTYESEGVYSLNYDVIDGTPSGLKLISLYAIDATNRTAESLVKYRVIKKTGPQMIWDGDNIKAGKGERFYDANDAKSAGAKVMQQNDGGSTEPGSLFMHFIHGQNLYNVMTWRLSENDNPADSKDISDYGFVEFKIRSNAPAGSDIEFSIRDSSPQLHSSGTVFLKQGGYLSSFSSTSFTTVKIPMSALTAGSEINLDQIWQFNFSVNTASQGFDVWIDDIKVLPYSHPYKEPKLSNVTISRLSGYADGLTNITVSGKVSDPDQDLKEVYIDLSELNGLNHQGMTLTDDLFSHTFTVPNTVVNGVKKMTVTAADQAGNAVDQKIDYKVIPIASNVMLWDGDTKNTGEGVTVNTQTKVNIDSTGGKDGSIGINFHMDQATDGFSGAMWDWNIGTADTELIDFSDKRYLNFYMKVSPPSEDFDMEVYLKDRYVSSTDAFKLKANGFITSYTGNYQLVQVPLDLLFKGDKVDVKQMTRFGLLTNQIFGAPLDIKLDHIFISGSNVADVRIKVSDRKCEEMGKIKVDTIFNQTGPFNYYINGAPNPAGLLNPEFSGLDTGKYVIRISGSNDFVYMEQLQVSGNGAILKLTSTITPGNVILKVDGGSGQYTYLWDNGATTANLTNVPPGTYVVVVTDVMSKCTASLSCIVTGSPSESKPELVITDAECAVNGKILVKGLAKELKNLKFYLNGVVNAAGISNPEFSNLKPATYTVKITADGFSFQIKAIVGGSGAAPIITGVAKNGNIDITVKGGSGIYTYIWSEGSTTQDLMEVADGTYVVTVTDEASGCKSTYSATTINYDAIVKVTAATCNPNGEIAISDVKGGNGEYRYYLNNVLNKAGADNPIFKGLKPATYAVKVTDNKGFLITKTVVVEGFASAPTITAVVKANNITTTVKGGSGIYTYNWSNGSTTAHLMEVPDGTYSLEVTDAASGCKATYQATVLVPYAEVETTNAACAENGTISVKSVNGKGTIRYSINNVANPAGYNEPIFKNLKQGIYTIKVEGDNGFLWSKKVTVGGEANSPVVTSIVNQGNVSLSVSGGSGIYIYQWSNGATTRDLREVSTGFYSVTVTDAKSGCKTKHEVIIAASLLQEDKKLIIYPNPAKADGIINLKYDFLTSLKRQILLKDLSGAVIWKATINDAVGTLNIQPLQLKTGLYIIYIDGPDPVVKRIMIN